MQRPSGLFILVCASILSYAPLSSAQGQGEESSRAAGLLAGWRGSVVQIQVIDNQAGSKAGIGSGFFAGSPDWVVTNYHVIAELVNEPGKYRARYVSDGGLEGSLELLAVDAVHDLAVLRTDELQRTPFAIDRGRQAQGERLYALGFPFDIGLTIVEGTNNGLLERSLYERLHYTGSINPGMSGGPAIDTAGRVVGVNVATAGNQVSFLVPAEFVSVLLDRAGRVDATSAALRRSVGEQLRDNQDRLAGMLLADLMPTTDIGDFTVPAGLALFINCWGDSDQSDTEDLALVYYQCQTADDIFLSGSLSTGIIRYQHDLLSTEALSPFRFYRQLEDRALYPSIRLDGDEQSVSNYTCQSDFVNQTGVALKVTFCLRRYLDFDALYDGYLSATSLQSPREALQSTLVLAGFSWGNLRTLSTRFLESIRYRDR